MLLLNSEVLDQTSHHAESGLDLYCFPMYHNKNARRIWVNVSEA